MTATTNSTDYIRSLDTNDPNDVDAILEVTNTDRDDAFAFDTVYDKIGFKCLSASL